MYNYYFAINNLEKILGTCNNLDKPLLGAAYMPLARLTLWAKIFFKLNFRLKEPIYDDNTNAPVGKEMR